MYCLIATSKPLHTLSPGLKAFLLLCHLATLFTMQGSSQNLEASPAPSMVFWPLTLSTFIIALQLLGS
jgi:hypothetical protein